MFITFQMMLMIMMIISKISTKCPFRELLQRTDMQAVQWTNTLPWLVMQSTIYLELLATISADAFDFLCVFLFHFVSFLQELKVLLLGSSLNCFSVEWRNQGFTFSETHDLRYGIVQKKVYLSSPYTCI